MIVRTMILTVQEAARGMTPAATTAAATAEMTITIMRGTEMTPAAMMTAARVGTMTERSQAEAKASASFLLVRWYKIEYI
jgi:hypothetical protein